VRVSATPAALAPGCRPRTVVYAVTRWTVWSTVAVCLLARKTSAHPAPVSPAAPAGSVFPTAELDYQVAPGLICPSAEELRAAVAKEMSYDPFDGGPGVPVGRFHVIVSRDRRPGVLVVRVSFDDPAGKQGFETEFEGTPATARTCNHLVTLHAVADIATEITLQLARIMASLPPRTCSSSTEHPAACPELVATGWGSFGLSAEAGVRYRAVSLGVEAHGDPSLGSATVHEVGAVSFARLSGALLLCAHWGWFVGCGIGDAGRFLFPDHAQVLPASVFYGAVGARAGLEFPVGPPHFFLRAGLDFRAPIHPASYVRLGTSIFEASGPGVGLGLGALVELSP
jgi:hypothetical protein